MNEMLLYIRGLRKDYDIPLHGKRKKCWGGVYDIGVGKWIGEMLYTVIRLSIF